MKNTGIQIGDRQLRNRVIYLRLVGQISPDRPPTEEILLAFRLPSLLEIPHGEIYPCILSRFNLSNSLALLKHSIKATLPRVCDRLYRLSTRPSEITKSPFGAGTIP
jgi:hypothetical protein